MKCNGKQSILNRLFLINCRKINHQKNVIMFKQLNETVLKTLKPKWLNLRLKSGKKNLLGWAQDKIFIFTFGQASA